MDEQQKKEVAVFRFGVISDFVSPARLEWGERERLLGEKCARQWQIPFSGRTSLSRTTILSWVRAYERGGRRLEAIYPRDRSDQGTQRALDEETVLALIRLRRQVPLGHAAQPNPPGPTASPGRSRNAPGREHRVAVAQA